MTESSFVRQLKKDYKEVYRNLAIQRKYVVEEFCMGTCICKNKKTGETAYFDFKRSPNGHRYYYRIA